MPDTTIVDTAVELSEALLPYADLALERMAYLYPDVTFRRIGIDIMVCGPCVEDDVRRDLRYAVYRAKIASETADLRQMLFRAALQS